MKAVKEIIRLIEAAGVEEAGRLLGIPVVSSGLGPAIVLPGYTAAWEGRRKYFPRAASPEEAARAFGGQRCIVYKPHVVRAPWRILYTLVPVLRYET